MVESAALPLRGAIRIVATSDGTGLAGTDYTALTAVTGMVSFADGDSASKTVSIPLLDDNLAGETSPDTVNLTLGSLVGATAGAQITAALMINEDNYS